MSIVALEGPSCAGKTTVIRHLRETPALADTALFFGCYVRHIRPVHEIPPPRTFSAAEQFAAFETFMSAEADRAAETALNPGRLVILDRSVDTLMAHAYAMDRLHDFGVHEQVRRRLEELPHLRPDHTIYLDVSTQTLRQRRAAAGEEAEYFLHDPDFLAQARAYFTEKPEPPITGEITVLPADGPANTVARAVRALVEVRSR
ncbi:AAA family ATPase [Streptomyces turgidiscabies]|uniref:AAA family ATPase n=1 Tax=Streptomyces turgidiscabies TaxID=85558 RepID=UPI0038F6BCAD